MPYSGFGGSSDSQGNCRTNSIGLQFTDASMLRPMISIATMPHAIDVNAEEAEIDRTDLGVADLSEPVVEPALSGTNPRSRLQRNARIDAASHLHLREEILILGHGKDSF